MDKKISIADLRWERVDVVIGSVLTGVIGLAIAVACAATLHQGGRSHRGRRRCGEALRPLAGRFATVLFGAGLLGASLLAAAIVPIATAYSIAEGVGEPASLDLDSRHFQWFYAAFVGLTIAAVSVVSLPALAADPADLHQPGGECGAAAAARDRAATAGERRVDHGRARTGPWSRAAGWVSIALIVACVGALAWSWIG